MAVQVCRTALRGAKQACTVTLAVCSVHGAKCPLPMLASVEVILPMRVAAVLPIPTKLPWPAAGRAHGVMRPLVMVTCGVLSACKIIPMQSCLGLPRQLEPAMFLHCLSHDWMSLSESRQDNVVMAFAESVQSGRMARSLPWTERPSSCAGGWSWLAAR